MPPTHSMAPPRWHLPEIVKFLLEILHHSVKIPEMAWEPSLLPFLFRWLFLFTAIIVVHLFFSSDKFDSPPKQNFLSMLWQITSSG